MSDVKLKVDNKDYTGWTSIEVSKGIEDLSGSFSLVLTNRWRDDKESLAIRPGRPCKVSIEGETIIDGYIDVLSISYNADFHEIRVSGRDKAADLIDCAVANGTGEYKNLTFDKIIEQIVSPFGISVKNEVPSGSPIKKFNIEQGMSAYEAIQKLCLRAGCLAVSDNEGNLILTRAGTESGGTGLIEKENILEAIATYDFTQRFSKYIVKGQKAGKDNEDAVTATTAKSEVTDSNVDRYRPTLIVADGQNDKTKAETRAKWEAAVRRGKSRVFEITVQGWLDGSGSTWKTNQLLNLDAPNLGVSDNLVVANTIFRLDEGGERTTLSLSPAEAFTPLPSTSAEEDSWESDLEGLGEL